MTGSEPRRSWLGACAGLAAALAAIGLCLVTASYLHDTPGGDVASTFVRKVSSGANPLPEQIEKLRALTAPYDYQGARYLFACTAPTDRVLISSGYRPELYYAAGRGFAAGRLYYLNSLAPSPEFKAWSLERFRVERVPIVLVNPDDNDLGDSFPAMKAYLGEHYRPAGRVEFWGSSFDVLVDPNIPPTRSWDDGLPCYR